jgi:hypothetical protein
MCNVDKDMHLYVSLYIHMNMNIYAYKYIYKYIYSIIMYINTYTSSSQISGIRDKKSCFMYKYICLCVM